MSKSEMKIMLITFFNIKCIVHFAFTPQGQTVNQVHYVEILTRLREPETPELWHSNCILHHDTAPTHKALSVKYFLA
jgi:hypothetical protein